MSNKFGEGYIEIKADNKAFLKGLSDTKTLFTGWAGELAAAAGIIGFGAMIKDITDFGDEMVKTAQRVGIGVEALQKFAYSAKLSDVDMGSLTVGLRTLSRNMVLGTTETQRAFTALGLSTRQLASMGLDKALGVISDKFKELPDGATKAALALEMFGRGGLQMVPWLNQGSEAIAEQAKELEDLGAVMSEKTAKQAEELNDNMTRLGMVGRYLAITIGNEVIPMLVNATSSMIAWWKANGEVIRQDITKFLEGAAITGHAFGQAISDLGTMLPKTFNLGDAAVRGFWTILNMAGFELSKLAEATAWYYEVQLGQVKELVGLALSLPASMQPEWLHNMASQAWTDLDRWQKTAGEAGAKFHKMGEDFKLGFGTMMYASDHLTMSWNTGTEATKQYSKELDDLLRSLTGTGKEAQKQAKVMMDAYSDMLMLLNGPLPTDISGMAAGGILSGGESLWGRDTRAGYAGGNLGRGMGSFPDMSFMPLTDEQRSVLMGGGAADLVNYMNTVMSSLIPGEGMTQLMVESWDDMISQLQEEQQKLIDSFSFMGMNLTEMSDWMSGIISNFFADSAAQGFGQGIRKMIGALINTYADFVIKNGMVAMATGLFEVIMGSSPVWPRPDWVAHGGYAIAQGAVLLGIGGALKGGAAAIGGTFSGAGGGASFQTNAARPTAGTVQPVNYTVGSNGQPTAATGNTNINVYAYDSESLKDYVQKNKHTFADGVLAAGFENHPVRNGW